MGDYISREAVLQKFLERGSGYINELTMLYMINEIPAADVQPVNQWISVKDRLPEPGQNVLIYYPHWEGDEIQTAKFSENKLWFEICGEFDVERNSATHWQPLPEPPKKENDNDT